ncbi:leucyl aminopeptidase [Sphingobium boeckii]|uniref:Probable cytosol aminopeptidase n=1 Tax=Sphingobium boeckii TaxID=1082345 RepID=A0A7W9AKW5_9SPHN|nr:leucyl aminopeptidase [Sphingobium boeckii]MBB5687361.1 leucyl aminopeptidase [Sphingobium boeckii]
MRIIFADSQPEGAFALALPLRKGADFPATLPGVEAGGVVLAAAAAKAARFEGDAAATAETMVPAGQGTRRVVLVGLGEKPDALAWERVGGALTARLLVSGEKTLVVDLSAAVATGDEAARLAFGALLRGWRHDIYRTKLPAKSKPTLEEIVIVGGGAAALKAWESYAALAEGVMFTRTLVTEPANIIYPESFVERCQHLAELGVEIEILDEPAMEKLGMGSLLGVSLGSARPARLLALRWDGTGGTEKTPVALVGKGVTFDTGGISIKPAAGMEDMKWDMGGAGAVAGTMKALAARKAKVHVIGICGLVENMPDGLAQRPGDVVTSMSGQTIEVINTDAEGRLVLCDAMTWVQRKYKPKFLVDLATLTGAIIVSLGTEYAGIFANDDALAESLMEAGKAAGDPLWRMPLSDAYNKLIDSPIADMKNVGAKGAGSITAAQFLQRFVEEGVKWAHLDIAGMVWADKPGPVWDKGATGYGVRLLNRFIADNFEK